MRFMFILAGCLWITLAAPVRAGDHTAVSRLGWLEGCWTGEKAGVVSEEHWTSPAGGGLVGLHKDVKAGRMAGFEYFRIVAVAADSVCYLASPGGAPPVAFCLVEQDDTRVVFENRGHDFPQRILYWLDESQRLHARVEGTIGEKVESEEWTWTRCRR